MAVQQSVRWAFCAVVIAVSMISASAAIAAESPAARAAAARQQTGNQNGTPWSRATAQAFARADNNGNGYIDRSEAALVPGLKFSRADTNCDGKVSWSELEIAFAGTGNKTANAGASRKNSC